MAETKRGKAQSRKQNGNGGIKLSPRAARAVERLVKQRPRSWRHQIAAVDPATGHIYFGRDEIEASRKGREARRNPRALFFFVRVGSPAAVLVRGALVEGRIHQKVSPLFSARISGGVIEFGAGRIPVVVDTGFSGDLVVSAAQMARVESTPLGIETMRVVGGQRLTVPLFEIRTRVGRERRGRRTVPAVALAIGDEWLLGMSYMRKVASRLEVDLEEDRVRLI